MIALLEHFNLKLNEKVSFRSNDSKLGMLFLTIENVSSRFSSDSKFLSTNQFAVGKF